MNLDQFLSQVQQDSENVQFEDSISCIDTNYDFTESAFKNGDTHNAAGENNGSCKIFAFAKLQQLTEEQTLNCFGKYYREDVLGNPDGDDHQNIRNFISHGWAGIKFKSEALSAK